METKNKKIPGSWYFLAGVIMVYAAVYFISPGRFFLSLKFFFGLAAKIAPALLLVLALMIITNFLPAGLATRHLSGRGIKQYGLAIAGGIISSGPAYVWFPFLADLRRKGASNGLVACFIYNRAIKIPLLPVFIYYFGWLYVLVLTIVMIAASIVQALVIDWLMAPGAKAESR